MIMTANDLLAIIGDKEVQLVVLRAEYKKLQEHHRAEHTHKEVEQEKR